MRGRVCRVDLRRVGRVTCVWRRASRVTGRPLHSLPQANSAILNALLTLLNERLFDNGNQRLHAPLLCLVGEGAPPAMPDMYWPIRHNRA